MATWNDRLAGWFNTFLVEQVATRVAKWLPRSQAFIEPADTIVLPAATQVRFTMTGWERIENDRYVAFGYIPIRNQDGSVRQTRFKVYLDSGLTGEDMGEVLDPATGASM